MTVLKMIRRRRSSRLSDPRIRYVRQEHLGIPSARNRGVLESKGEWVVIMDDDDVMLPNRLEDHLAAVGDGVSGSYGGWIDINEAIH